MTNREKYDLLLQAARTAPKGQLMLTAIALFGASTHNTIRTHLRRLELAGYDLAEWRAAGKDSCNASAEKDEEQYAAMMQAARTAPHGHMTRVASELTGLSEGGLRGLRHRLEGRGFDFAEWNAAVDQGRGRSRSASRPERAGKPRPPAKPRAAKSKPGDDEAVRHEAVRPPSIKASWRIPEALPVVEPPPRYGRQLWPETPYTMQSVADIVGMPVMAVRFAARAHGIGFDVWCLSPAVALGLLAALGFTREVAA